MQLVDVERQFGRSSKEITTEEGEHAATQKETNFDKLSGLLFIYKLQPDVFESF